MHVQDMQHLIVTRMLLPSIQGHGNLWHAGGWVNWLGHSGSVDAGMAVACRTFTRKGCVCVWRGVN